MPAWAEQGPARARPWGRAPEQPVSQHAACVSANCDTENMAET